MFKKTQLISSISGAEITQTACASVCTLYS